MITVEQAYKVAQDAYTQAFGQVHDTPDGKYCWMGRLDRARTILADKKGDPQTKVKIDKLQTLVNDAVALAEQRYIEYQRAAVASGKVPQDMKSDCVCPACKREITFRIVAVLNKCKSINGKTGGLFTEEADQFQADADKLGIAVEWHHLDLNTHEWKEGRGHE